MGRKYTNKKGELIELTQQHLDRAVEIYEELAKLSPSRRVSWARLTKMMEHDGFTGAESSEPYRQVIKFERKKQGTLPEVETYAELTSASMRDSIRAEIGEMRYTKQELQDASTRMSKMQRELSRGLLLNEAIESTIGNIDWATVVLPEYNPQHDASEDKVMLATLNDIHYGYNVEEFATIEDVKETLNKYADKLIALGIKEGISKIVLANLGDTIENKLHAQSKVDAQISSSRQMVEATYAIIAMIGKLQEHFLVDYLVLEGNHDRIEANYKQALDGDSYVDINIAMTEMFFLDYDTVKVLDTTSPYYHITEIQGNNIYMAHGHRVKAKSNTLLSELSANYDVLFDIVLTGHFHSLLVNEVAQNRFQIITGALKDNDRFSEKINKSAGKNQIGIIFNDGDFEIRVINVD